VQYRSKFLTEIRKEKVLTMKRFSEVAQDVLDEILELFKKYRYVQTLFNEEEKRFWTTWLYTLHPDSKKTSKEFYFYKKVEFDGEEFKPTGGVKLLDLHRPFIDEIILKDDVGNIYNRIPDVLDTWGDSGSMPWASQHYPFENKEFVEKNIPADWIIEAQDQTRGWFRVLHVLSTGIFNKPAFNTVNTTGMVLATDGRKMSKSKQNFTDPNVLLEKYGADSVRAYLLNSNLLDADSLSFNDLDLKNTFRDTTLLLSNSSKFVEYVLKMYSHLEPLKSYRHPLNKWWLNYTKNYVSKIKSLMDDYLISEASKLIVPYIQEFSTWYIRRSKDLLEEYGHEVACVLKETMQLFAQSTASLQPFNMERLWQIVKDPEDPNSVHLTNYPVVVNLEAKDFELLSVMSKVKDLVSTIHGIRKEREIRVRQPLYADFTNFKVDEKILELFKKECNLLDRDLARTEGEIFDTETDFGPIKIDLVVDSGLAVLGFIRDFERSVQSFRKKQGLQAGQIVEMKWQPIEIIDEDIFNEVIKKIDWQKLCVDVKWVKNLDSKLDKNFEIKELAKILVD